MSPICFAHVCVDEILDATLLNLRTSWLFTPYILQGRKTVPLAHEALRKFPKTWAYLSKRRPELSGRDYFESSSKTWYELWCARSLEHQQARKIVVAELGETGRFGIAGHDLFYGDTVCGITLKTGVSEDLLYVLCL